MPLNPMAAKAMVGGVSYDPAEPAGKTAERFRTQAGKEAVQEAAVQPDDVLPYESIKGLLKLVLKGALPMGALGMIFKGTGRIAPFSGGVFDRTPFKWTYSTDALKDFAGGVEKQPSGKFLGLVDPNTEHLAYAHGANVQHEDLLKELRQQLPDKMRGSGEKLPALGDNLAHARYGGTERGPNFINPNWDAKDLMGSIGEGTVNPTRMANVERRNLDKIRAILEAVKAIPKDAPMNEGSFWQHYVK